VTGGITHSLSPFMEYNSTISDKGSKVMYWTTAATLVTSSANCDIGLGTVHRNVVE
jgi:hypothetical protein